MVICWIHSNSERSISNVMKTLSLCNTPRTAATRSQAFTARASGSWHEWGAPRNYMWWLPRSEHSQVEKACSFPSLRRVYLSLHWQKSLDLPLGEHGALQHLLWMLCTNPRKLESHVSLVPPASTLGNRLLSLLIHILGAWASAWHINGASKYCWSECRLESTIFGIYIQKFYSRREHFVYLLANS